MTMATLLRSKASAIESIQARAHVTGQASPQEEPRPVHARLDRAQLDAQLRHERGVPIACLSREEPRSFVRTGLLIGPFHHARSEMHLTLLPGQAGRLASIPFGILSA